MDSLYEIRKARKEYRCTEHSYHTIKVGDLYLCAVMTPWHECARGDKYEITRTCLRCCEEYGMHNSETRKQLAERAAVLTTPEERGEQ